MRTRKKTYHINHIQYGVANVTMTDGKGHSFTVPNQANRKTYPSNLRLKLWPATLEVTYIYGTDIRLLMTLNKQLVFCQSEKSFPEWEEFFAKRSETEADIELAVRCYNNDDRLLLYNLYHEYNDVFKIRQEILLKYYRKEVPNLVARLKVENNIICALRGSLDELVGHHFNKRQVFLEKLQNYAGALMEYPSFVNWCLEEMTEMAKLYGRDKQRCCQSTPQGMRTSEVIKRSSKLIPITISDERIQEYINSTTKPKKETVF